MERIIILFLIMLIFPTMAFAQKQEPGSWVKDWWENVIEVQTNANLAKEEKNACEQKLGRYRKKVEEKPNSEYYKMKLEKWTKRCTTPAK